MPETARWRSASAVLLDRMCRTTSLLRVLACSWWTLCQSRADSIEPMSPSTKRTFVVRKLVSTQLLRYLFTPAKWKEKVMLSLCDSYNAWIVRAPSAGSHGQGLWSVGCLHRGRTACQTSSSTGLIDSCINQYLSCRLLMSSYSLISKEYLFT